MAVGEPSVPVLMEVKASLELSGELPCGRGITVTLLDVVIGGSHAKIDGMILSRIPLLKSWAAGLLAGAFMVSIACAQQPATPAAQTPPAASSGYHLDATWKIGGEGGWDYLCFDADARRLYIAREDRIQVIDADTGALAGEVPGLDGAHGVALVPALGRGFASSGKSDAVIIFDLKSLKPVGTPVRVGNKPDAIVYDPASKHVLAMDGKSGDATVIDPESGKVLATVALGGKPEFAAADGKGTVFINLEDKSEIVALDTSANSIRQRWPIAPGESPTGLSIDVEKHRLFAGCANEKMMVLDAGSGKVLAALAIGKGVDATAFDPGTGFAFASNGDGTLTVVEEGAQGEFQVVENVKSQPGARTMALDLKTHAIFLAAASFQGPIVAGGGKHQRPPMVPGSFVILKFVR